MEKRRSEDIVIDNRHIVQDQLLWICTWTISTGKGVDLRMVWKKTTYQTRPIRLMKYNMEDRKDRMKKRHAVNVKEIRRSKRTGYGEKVSEVKSNLKSKIVGRYDKPKGTVDERL